MSGIGMGGSRESPPPANSPPSAAGRAVCLRFRDGAQEHWLTAGETVVGRGTRCELVVDDSLVSRRHARFFLEGDGVTLEDLGSVNGVYVNGARLEAPILLHQDDRILIGREIFIVHFDDPEPSSVQRVTRRPPAPPTRPPPPMVNQRPMSGEHRVTDSSSTTDEGSGLDVLASLADKVLALGRGEDAEKILAGRLQNVLKGARAGAIVPPQTCDSAGRCAVKLAMATGRVAWVDYLVDLYSLARRPWPASIIDEMHTVLRKVPLLNLAGLREYLRVLQSESTSGTWGPAERFLLQRIEGLERTATKQT